MEHVYVKVLEDCILVGELPRLVVNLKTQKHVLEFSDKKEAYPEKIFLSPDLLRGERCQVLQSAMDYYYRRACRYAQDMEAARQYRRRKNIPEQ